VTAVAKKRVVTNLSQRHYDILVEIAEKRGETSAQILREAVLKYMANLGYLPEDEKKALGR